MRLNQDKKLRKIWVEQCNRGDLFNPSTGHICSAHFEDSDFERDLQAELLNLPSRKRLKESSCTLQKFETYGRHEEQC
ncbi:uncharacterized protein LOC108915494 isoform X2 [Anoplophora glabripennis]|uniref:uncharacterized protein LOC108915494 isoform X2 n=1 Tax=Anoplophora glabripennis TaxID=217634 RepID=UPI000875599F|nr:uncharacterized protein LOC108915494 isoform X2 [Anoplophora glabripennis]